MSDRVLLETRQLSIGYHKKIVAENLSFILKGNEMVCLIGRNGTGKSTLLRTIAALQQPIKGHIKLKGEDVVKMSRSRRARQISIVLSDAMMENSSFTVREMVALGRFPHTGLMGKLSAKDDEVIDSALQAVHLTNKATSPFTELSDGERQRTMIARALAQDTEIILLDEPTAHLDLPNKIDILMLLHDLAHNMGKGILLSNHELDLTLQTADKIWLLSPDGLLRGIPEDLVLTRKIDAYFHSPNFTFDIENGNFRINHTTQRNVRMQGSGIVASWTRHALERCGYCVDNDPYAPLIECFHEHKWRLTFQNHDEELDSIENLIYTLNELAESVKNQ
ncbi:MAG: ABC transporter ATP-binding protein [Paludibacteraceae bacterium]|nr:ABC transporter ATP-binding protein [Paludibacteraceae bacterium]